MDDAAIEGLAKDDSPHTRAGKQSRRLASVTIDDIARVADVHRSTVSRALDPEKAYLVNARTRRRIRDVASSMGYRSDLVAASLRRRRTKTLGVVVADLANPFYVPFVHGASAVFESDGYLPLVVDSRDDSERFMRVMFHLLSRRVDGIITSAARSGDEDVLDEVSREVPVVLGVRSLEALRLPTVAHDDEMGARAVVDHFVELGHRVVTQLRGPDRVASFAGRRRAFQRYAHERGLAVIDIDAGAEHPTVDEGYRLASRLVEMFDVPSAIFAHNDLMALGAIERLRESGLDCPHDVSVVGYNDGPIARFSAPALTTVRMHAGDIGRQAAQLMLEALRGESPSTEITRVPPELVVRESTRPAENR